MFHQHSIQSLVNRRLYLFKKDTKKSSKHKSSHVFLCSSLARPRTETFPDTWVMTGIVMGLELVTVGIGKTCEEDLSASSIHCMLASPQDAQLSFKKVKLVILLQCSTRDLNEGPTTEKRKRFVLNQAPGLLVMKCATTAALVKQLCS